MWLWSRRARLSAGTVVRVGVAVVIVLTAAFGLRLVRDDRTAGAAGLVSSSVARRASVSVNATMFDALMVVRSHWPSAADHVGMQYFLPFSDTGAAERAPSFNVEVARLSNPTRANGTPATAAGDWYAALGMAGVVVGGVLSGLLLLMLERWRLWLARWSVAASVAISVVFAFSLLSTGIRANTLDRLDAFLLPLVVIVGAWQWWLGGASPRRPQTNGEGALGDHGGDDT
ncbi:MAG TPA: hypothetical protein DCR14_11090, partial [Acidimicrobiaceae bacterium]|nr:hypothetical protein [Acidimicrobiaceae bacterium]